MIGVAVALGEQQQIAGIDRHAEPFDASSDRLDRGGNDVAAVGDGGGAEQRSSASLPSISRASALASGPTSCGTVSCADDPRSRRREARLEHPQGLRDDAGLEARAAVVETTPMRSGRKG